MVQRRSSGQVLPRVQGIASTSVYIEFIPGCTRVVGFRFGRGSMVGRLRPFVSPGSLLFARRYVYSEVQALRWSYDMVIWAPARQGKVTG